MFLNKHLVLEGIILYLYCNNDCNVNILLKLNHRFRDIVRKGKFENSVNIKQTDNKKRKQEKGKTTTKFKTAYKDFEKTI